MTVKALPHDLVQSREGVENRGSTNKIAARISSSLGLFDDYGGKCK
jgi:hypothetical protein